MAVPQEYWPELVAVTSGVCAASGLLAWAVRGRSAGVFGPSVWRGPRDRRSVALTFDDGPSEETPRILEILAAYKIPATFFQIGANSLIWSMANRQASKAWWRCGQLTATATLTSPTSR